MFTPDYKKEVETDAITQAKLRRMQQALEQEMELDKRAAEPQGFVKLTKRISEGEKRLISFITKSLAVDTFLDIGLLDAFPL